LGELGAHELCQPSSKCLILAGTARFPRGLTVLVGENNSGKTTIIDALRLILFSGRDFDCLRLSESDFRADTGHKPIEVSCRFTGLMDEDEVHFLECLVDIGNGKFEMRITARIEFNETTNRCKVRMWGARPKAVHFRIISTTNCRRSTCSRCVILNAASDLVSTPR